MTDTREHGIIVIGASAGGVEALQRLAACLPPTLPAAVFVVLHIGPRFSALPEILSRAGTLPACHAVDGAPIRPGRIYVAPPDHHLLITPGQMRLSRGPRENRARPAIDVLFRSAAQAYGPQVVGVVLTGGLNDGTAGLVAIKAGGGITVVQEPDEAKCPGMPLSALRHATIDHRLKLDDIPGLLARLAGPVPAPDPGMLPPEQSWTDLEAGLNEGYDLARPLALTCPTCGGALAETQDSALPCFTCHIGHRFVAADMDEAQFQAMERVLEMALRVLNERAALCERMAGTWHGKGFDELAWRWRAARDEAREKAEVLRGFIENGWLRPDPDGETGDA
ncbi:Chemotaxis protein CheB [Rhodovastum atsumiense]|uniref:protein-glutamate methylesterase n=1 Tax=Rhodovastum atsumiense TaxID=504468 RepID=A0A5M6ITZ7_9PROT|nr:chemotaxis protein CheB [Rhodovastum atsumiense]KAA5611409.1 chemotaxis protein CheB [Rhodovastum atsumiense]CAH2603574.1 Chemotaxis protein CheB [Rhodovastum atsumiense]